MDSSEARDLTALAQRHLWLHMSPPRGESISIVTEGDGCYIWDQAGRRYLDGLAGLFTVNAGHGRHEIAEAAAAQAGRLGYFPIWGNAHAPAIELAARLADAAPGSLNRVFFTSGGSEAVDTAWKLARQYHRANGEPQRTKVVSRYLAYHGTTFGALSITGIPALREPYEPLVPGVAHAQPAYPYRCAFCTGTCSLQCADDIERAIVMQGPETVAAVFLEPVQNTGGSLVPPEGYWARVREICDRYGVLLVSDEVICAFGRLGHLFGCERFGYQPDLITFAKGVTSGYAPLGGVMVSDHVADAFTEAGATFLHGYTFAGHPLSCAVALANLDVFDREQLCARVLEHQDAFRAALDSLTDIPIVGDVRGTGYFYSIEIVRDRSTKEPLSAEECRDVLKGQLSPRLTELGLICRADDRAEPVLVLAPPLVAGPEQFEEIRAALRTALVEAAHAIGHPAGRAS